MRAMPVFLGDFEDDEEPKWRDPILVWARQGVADSTASYARSKLRLCKLTLSTLSPDGLAESYPVLHVARRPVRPQTGFL